MTTTNGTKPFVHLHLHTCFSLLDGACRLPDLIDAAVENNMPAVAMTDHGVMYGTVDFYKAARQKGVKPIIGCETYVAAGSLHDRRSQGGKPRHNHLVLLARDDVGYHNLIKLVSVAQLEGFYYKPRIDKELLALHSEGLIGMSACLNGEIGMRLVNDDVDGAVNVAGEFTDILGKDNFYLEVMDHHIPEQRKVNSHMRTVSARTGLPIVATNDVHYLKKQHAAAHEVLLCLQTQTVMSDPKRMRYGTEEFYLKTREEMERLFSEFPGALDITLEIAERCNVELEFGRLHFPTFDTPDGLPQKQYLTELGHAGVRRLYNIVDPAHPKDGREKLVMDRFDKELAVIEKTGFVNYFLVVWDFINFAHTSGIPVGPGRGSGGGSLIAYALAITTIDPLRYELIFERFLNPERVSPPDFDIDFCQARREEVIAYVKNKYGREQVAQIITFGSLGAKTVIRDVGRALEVPYAECDRLSKMVPDDPKMTLQKALGMNPEFRKAYESDDNCKRILDYGFVLEGLYRNPGIHAAGVVIGETALTDIIPLARDKNKEPVTQYAMEPLGEIGLLKMDFLGLKTLTVIHEAVELARTHLGMELDIAHLPLDDAATYELLKRGDTVGVFQLESGGMRDLVRRIGVDRIEDIIALIALYRPGPMNMLPDFVDRKSGKAEAQYDHPLLEPVLKETYGVMVYQEQVQKAANILAGYSLGEADILRRAMGKKKVAAMEQQRASFIKGAAETNGISADVAGRVFDTMAKFAGYGFNKAHSTGYAIISYQTAYLKANCPAEFMAALLSSEIGNFDRIPVLISEVREMGMQVLAPDINSSGARFLPAENGVHYGLGGVKNVGSGAAAAIVDERTKSGPFAGLIDFCSRLDSQTVNKKVIESLVRCGAFGAVGENRARMFGAIDFAMARAAGTQRDRASGQGSLFDLMALDEQVSGEDDLPDCEPWSESELLKGEKELLGVYLSGHPLTRHASLLNRYCLSSVEGLAALQDRTETRIGGIVVSVTRRVTKARQELMAVAQVEDFDGSVEAVVFPEAFGKYGARLVEEAAVMVCGEVSRREEPPRLIASEIYPLSDVPKLFATHVRVHLPTAHAGTGVLERIKEIARMHPGTIPLTICLLFPAGEKVFVEAGASFGVSADEELVQSLEQEIGEDSVYVDVNPTPCRNAKSRRSWQ